MMTPKERLQAVLAGKTPDRVPFAPFAELIPRSEMELRWRNRGMGFILHSSSVFSESSMARITTSEGGKTVQTIQTPAGALREEFSYQAGASNDGMVQTGFMIRDEKDYAAAIAYIDSISFQVDGEGDEKIRYYLGGEGVTHAWAGEPPYMAAQYYLGLEQWSYDQQDYPEEFTNLLCALQRMQERNLHCLVHSRENMINLGNLAGNFSPHAFEKHMVPYFARFSQALHRAGKKTTLHADASNMLEHKGLVLPCGVDIVEAFTPPPVGNLSLADARAAWGEGVTILINFPETIFYSGYDETLRFTLELLKSDPCPNKILGLTEMGFVGANPGNMRVIEAGIEAILDAVNSGKGY